MHTRTRLFYKTMIKKPMPAQKHPLVSVNVITFNQASFLAETLDSILAQDYPNLEIVIADDASRDETPEIARAYAKRDTRIKLVLSTKNGGVVANCNRGLAACTGQYIVPFSGDDVMLPGKITEQVELLEANRKAAFCFHDMEWFESETGHTTRLHHTPQNPPAHTLADLLKHNSIGGPSVMLRASMLPKGGYNPTFPHAGDWLLWIEMALQHPFIYLDKPLVRYRRHPENQTRINPHIGTEQLKLLAHLKTIVPTALHPHLKPAYALSYQAAAIGHFSQGEAFKGLKALLNSLKSGNHSLKVGVGLGVGCLLLVLPNPLARRLWGALMNKRFR